MKQTLLEMAQDIASSMSSDEFNSITDTTESLQIANCIKQTYFNMISKYDLPEHNQLLQLTGSNDTALPVLMYRPEGVNRIEWVKYYDSNVSDSTTPTGHGINTDLQDNSNVGITTVPGYLYVDVIDLETFMNIMGSLNSDDPNVGTMTVNIPQLVTSATQNFTFRYRNDIQPKWCTIIQDYYMIFDSFDMTQDSSLQSSKSLCSAWLTPTWTQSDEFIPNIDEDMFPMLLNESKSLSFFEIKQQPHQKAEQEITRQRASLQKFKGVAERPLCFDALPHFGRIGGGTGR